MAETMPFLFEHCLQATEKWPASDYADYCHFNKAAAKRLGEIVASRLAKVAGL